MPQWVNGEDGPQCTCGWPTKVTIPQGSLPILWCFGHTKAEGACWCLPVEKPDNWPNLSVAEMQSLVARGEQEHSQNEKENE